MEIVKVLEILNNHIISLETEIQLKDWEIARLNEKLESIEGYVNRLGGNNEIENKSKKE